MRAGRRVFPLLPALATCAAGLYAAYLLRQALLPFLLSFAVAYVVNPLIDAVETRGVRRFHIVLTFYVLVGSLFYILLQHLLPVLSTEFALLRAGAPDHLASAQRLLVDLESRAAHRLPRTGLPIGEMAARAYASVLEQIQHLPSYILGLFPLLSLLFLVPFISFFLLLDGPALIGACIQATPSRYV